MAANKKNPGKTKLGKKGIRGRMPVKRSINLVLVDENKIALTKAIPGIIIIIILASLFSKYMVADRLIAMSKASARTAKLQSDLNNALELSRSFGDIEHTYAHYTYTGMTNEELSMVDRTMILDLVKTVLPTGNTQKTWMVSGNILTMEVTGDSLEELNELGRKMEEAPIVDSCTITTANKKDKVKNNKVIDDTEVRAKYIVYLKQPEETEAAAETGTSEEASQKAEEENQSEKSEAGSGSGLKPGEILAAGGTLAGVESQSEGLLSNPNVISELQSEGLLSNGSASLEFQSEGLLTNGSTSVEFQSEGLLTNGSTSVELQSEGMLPNKSTALEPQSEGADSEEAWADAVLARGMTRIALEEDESESESESESEIQPEISSGIILGDLSPKREDNTVQKRADIPGESKQPRSDSSVAVGTVGAAVSMGLGAENIPAQTELENDIRAIQNELENIETEEGNTP